MSSSGVESTDSLARVEDIPHRDEEIHLSSLRSKENSFPPIFSLPSELLELIFILVAQDHWESSDSRLTYDVPDVPDWVNVSYVCRHWRNVALDCSTLWTCHFNLSLRWTEELLRRSRQAPLKIRCIDTDRAISWWPGLLENWQNHSERIHELYLRISPSDLPAELFLHAPRLEVLVIAANEPHNGRLVVTDAGRPVLRTIGLENCLLQWNLLNLSEVEALSLSHDSLYEQFHIVELFTALHSMKNLTALHISNGLPNDVMSNDDYGVSHKIDLPHLAYLVVNAPLAAVISLLSCLEFPLETRISLALWLEHNPPTSAEDYAPILSFLAQRFNAGQPLTTDSIIRSMGMYVGSCTGLTFSSLEYDCRSRSAYQYEGLDVTIPLEIAFRNRIEAAGLYEGTALLHPIMADICRSLSLTNVQTLYVCGDGVFYRFNFWKEVLECLDGLRYLKVESTYMPDLSALSLPAREPEENSDGESSDAQDATLGRILVPALARVALDGVRFLPDSVAERHGGMSHKAFIDILSSRNIQDKAIAMQYRVSE